MPSFLTTDFFSKFLLFSLVLVTSYLCYFCAWNSSLLSHPAIPKHRACSSALSNKTLVCLVTICLLKLTDCYWIPFSSFISLLGNPWISSDFLQIWVFIWSWSVLPFPSSGDLPDPGIEPRSPTVQADSLPSEPPGRMRSCVFVPVCLLFQRFHAEYTGLDLLPVSSLGYGPDCSHCMVCIYL